MSCHWEIENVDIETFQWAGLTDSYYFVVIVWVFSASFDLLFWDYLFLVVLECIEPLQTQIFLLMQWFSMFLILRPFNSIPHVVITPNHKIVSLLLHIYKCYCHKSQCKYLKCNISDPTPKGITTYRVRITVLVPSIKLIW